MKKTGIIIAVVIALALSLGGFGYYNQVYLPAQATATPAYNTTKVRSGDISITADGFGNILPSESVSVGFKISGILEELNIKVGDKVETGQVLGKLDDSNAILKLEQAELAYNTFYSQSSLQQAQIDQLNAKKVLDAAEDELEYLISPQVYYWEEALEIAEVDLAQLKSATEASESEIEAAQRAVDRANSYLLGARNEYYESYVWEVFPYTYTDEDTDEEIETYLEPTKDQVDEARLKVKSAELALLDAEQFLVVLQAGPYADIEIIVSDAGSNLAKLEDARLDLEVAQAAVEDAQLIAPVSGTVTSLSASVGQVIGTNPVVTIETLDQMSLRFYVEESDIHHIKIGNPVNITFDAYPDTPIVGQITYLEPALQTVDGNPAAVVWASFPETEGVQLLSGMSADVEVVAGESLNTLLVPVQALRELAPGSYAVFKMQPDGTLALTPVTVGLMDYANAEILSGLEQGDVISTGAVETK